MTVLIYVLVDCGAYVFILRLLTGLTHGELFLIDVAGLNPSGEVLDIIEGFLENGDLFVKIV